MLPLHALAPVAGIPHTALVSICAACDWCVHLAAGILLHVLSTHRTYYLLLFISCVQHRRCDEQQSDFMRHWGRLGYIRLYFGRYRARISPCTRVLVALRGPMSNCQPCAITTTTGGSWPRFGRPSPASLVNFQLILGYGAAKCTARRPDAVPGSAVYLLWYSHFSAKAAYQ